VLMTWRATSARPCAEQKLEAMDVRWAAAEAAGKDAPDEEEEEVVGEEQADAFEDPPDFDFAAGRARHKRHSHIM
jgi:hypothetical protein